MTEDFTLQAHAPQVPRLVMLPIDQGAVAPDFPLSPPETPRGPLRSPRVEVPLRSPRVELERASGETLPVSKGDEGGFEPDVYEPDAIGLVEEYGAATDAISVASLARLH